VRVVNSSTEIKSDRDPALRTGVPIKSFTVSPRPNKGFCRFRFLFFFLLGIEIEGKWGLLCRRTKRG
jgi:hypothetical protein